MLISCESATSTHRTSSDGSCPVANAPQRQFGFRLTPRAVGNVVAIPGDCLPNHHLCCNWRANLLVGFRRLGLTIIYIGEWILIAAWVPPPLQSAVVPKRAIALISGPPAPKSASHPHLHGIRRSRQIKAQIVSQFLPPASSKTTPQNLQHNKPTAPVAKASSVCCQRREEH